MLKRIANNFAAIKSVFLLGVFLTSGDVLSEENAESEDLADTRPAQPLAADGRVDPYDDGKLEKFAPLLGSDWAVSFGGYGKVDLITDFSGTGNKKQFVLATIPVDGSPPPGSYSNLQASETRFNVTVLNTKSKYDDDKFFLEVDFFDEDNDLAPRLRHAYFQYGNLLAGRTWTLLTELRQLPLLLDFAAGDSILGGRTEQIRWQQANENKTFGWGVALENFDDESVYNPDDLSGEARADFPRLAAGMTRIWPGVIWSLGGAVTQVRWDGDTSGGDASELGYTVTTAGRLFLNKENDNWLGFGVGYASGSITDIITYANGGVPNAAIDASGKLELAKAWNTQLGLHWNWTQVWATNISLAYARMSEVPTAFDPDFIRAGGSVHANVIYTHDERIKVGLEAMHGNRENVSGRDGDASRLQFSIFYYF